MLGDWPCQGTDQSLGEVGGERWLGGLGEPGERGLERKGDALIELLDQVKWCVLQ